MTCIMLRPLASSLPLGLGLRYQNNLLTAQFQGSGRQFYTPAFWAFCLLEEVTLRAAGPLIVLVAGLGSSPSSRDLVAAHVAVLASS
jgi:hypothetical protein